MSLSPALNIAQPALQTMSRQTSVVSRNVADASNPHYSRRTAPVVSTAPGVRSIDIQRATSNLQFRQNLMALSVWAGQATLANKMDRLSLAVNGVDNVSSASAAIGRLQRALQLYSTSPSNQNLGAAVIDAAKQVMRALNDGTTAIQGFRTQTDGEIATAVSDLNTLLAQFEDVNTAMVSGTRSGTDVSDALDQRDSLLKKIAEYVPVSTYTRGGNDMVITTTNGTTLFETIPRSVSFSPSPGYDAKTAGNTVYIDNVPVAGGTGGNTDAGGKIAGLIQLRDGVSGTMQGQLDEIARGVITAFAETSPPASAVAGLFTWTTTGDPSLPTPPNIPAAGTLVNGLAGAIRVNAAMDPTQGGDVTALRDGSTYVANPAHNASFSDLLIKYGNALDEPMAFSPAAGITSTSSVTSYSANAIGWFQRIQQQAPFAADSKEALATRSAEALPNETGINVDIKMSLLLDLEHTYQASARILNTVNRTLDALLREVR